MTGGNGGIGLGLARRLAGAGASVNVAVRNAEKSAAAVRELQSLGTDAHRPVGDFGMQSTVDAALKSVAVAKRLNDLGALPVGGPPEKLAAFQPAEREKWGYVIQAGKIKPD